MSTLYNIYRIKIDLIQSLRNKIKTTELVEQKTRCSRHFITTFYYSENIQGHDVWWWEIYKSYIKQPSKKPKNIFHYGLLISIPKKRSSEYAYIVSLGKSHFYLMEFIEKDFGINLAIRIADEKTILLKKSTYFSNVKKADISSYEKFIVNSYEPGESVDHLKLKAQDTDVWGTRNIIFADSVQISDEIKPENIDRILARIEDAMTSDENIFLPKLEMIKGEHHIKNCDSLLLSSIKNDSANISISEFEICGSSISVMPDDYNFMIYTRTNSSKYTNKRKLGSTLQKEDIISYLNDSYENLDLNCIRIKFYSESSGTRTKSLKEIIEFNWSNNGEDFFLRNGTWYKFNKTFLQYLKNSLNSIPALRRKDLDENTYLKWKKDKEKRIQDAKVNNLVKNENEITYREYYFNEMISQEEGYELWDRRNKLIASINEGAKNYKVEVADLYKDNEIISVKISDDISDIVYNITQSFVAAELYNQNLTNMNEKIKKASLWFVFEKEIEFITDFNSIQFLLSLQSWKKNIERLGLVPGIYISQHIKS